MRGTTPVPAAVLRRIEVGTQDLLRLLRFAAEDRAVVQAGRLEAAFRKQLDMAALVQEEADAAGVRALVGVPAAWMTAVWEALSPHCYATLLPRPAAAAPAAEGDRKGPVGVVVFNWAAALERVAAEVPYEGWTEQQLMTAVAEWQREVEQHPPAWLPHFSGADSLACFVRRHFPHLLVVTRSAVTGAAIFHAAGCNSVSPTWLQSPAAASTAEARRLSSVCAGLQHALHTLGRGHQLPVWTDAEVVAPLLAAETGLASAEPSAWREVWARHPDLRGAFQLSAYVRVRAVRSAERLLVIVDATSLDAPAVVSLLAAVTAGAASGAGTSVKLLRRAATPPAEALQALREAVAQAVGPAALVEDVVVDALLEPQHMLGALLDAEAATASEQRVVLLCGTKGRSAFNEALAEAKLPVKVLTPTAA